MQVRCRQCRLLVFDHLETDVQQRGLLARLVRAVVSTIEDLDDAIEVRGDLRLFGLAE